MIQLHHLVTIFGQTLDNWEVVLFIVSESRDIIHCPHLSPQWDIVTCTQKKKGYHAKHWKENESSHETSGSNKQRLLQEILPSTGKRLCLCIVQSTQTKSIPTGNLFFGLVISKFKYVFSHTYCYQVHCLDFDGLLVCNTVFYKCDF